MKTLLKPFLFLICILGLPLSESYAAIVFSGPSGGGGGNPFSDQMSNLQDLRVAEVIVRHGSLIDAIQINYEDKNGALIPGTKHGGNGGTEETFTLDDDEVITRVSGRHGTLIDSLTIETSKGRSQSFGGGGGSIAYEYAAPRGSRIMGFWGRSGTLVDAIGVIIAPSANLSNISYNGPVPTTGIKPAFIVLERGTFVITAESYPGAIAALPDAAVRLVTLGGTLLDSNDNCNVSNIADYIGRQLTTAVDACLVLALSPGAYVVEVSDAAGVGGNVLFSVTESVLLP